MHKYLYTLEPYNGSKSRFDCPVCQAKKRFTRYINTETGEYIEPLVGRCDRVNSCGYDFKPRDYFNQKGIPFEPRIKSSGQNPEPVKQTSYIPERYFKNNLKSKKSNNFLQFLDTLIGIDGRKVLALRYFMGTSNRIWPDSTLFWYVDKEERIRSGKIMLFNPNTGSRIKEPKPHVSWVHSQFKDFIHTQCFYGEHLLQKEPDKPVAIVESEKSAIIASFYFPQCIWLSCGSKNGLNFTKCQSLKGRDVILIPDLDATKEWQEKAAE